MKAHLFLTALTVICSTASVFAMDEKITKQVVPQQVMRSYLGFKTDKSLRIREYEAKNMEFAVPAKDFLGKKLTLAVPLSEADKKALKHGFKRAREKDERRTVPYSLGDVQFSAAIKYIKDKEQYSVRVTPVAPPTAL